MGDWWMLLVLAFIGLLIFGKRLPEVGKNMGRGIVEFKKGLSGIEDQLNPNTPSQPPPAARIENTAPRQVAEQGTPPSAATSDTELASMREEMRRMRDELNATKAKLADQDTKA